MKWLSLESWSAVWEDETKRTNIFVGLGILGMLMLGLSSLPSTTEEPMQSEEFTASAQESFLSENQLEERLETLIESIAGAGQTRVMVTWERSETVCYAVDAEYGADGGTKEQPVLLEKSGSSQEPALVETIEAPMVLGVAVVCEGGENIHVKYCITELVQALTGVSSNHVTVARMATTKEGAQP